MDGPLDDTVLTERSITVRDLLTFTFDSVTPPRCSARSSRGP
jgi:hypothetical protein